MIKTTYLKWIVLLSLGFFGTTISSCNQDDDNEPTTVTDVDGNVYETVTIGNQVWMAENLKTTHYRNGEPINYLTDEADWNNATAGAYCVYENDEVSNAIFGMLYNGFAVQDGRNLAPQGWHVATDADWTVLTDHLGGLAEAGGKLKETGFAHWSAPNIGATNETGFTALGAGLRGSGHFTGLMNYGYWWTSSSYNADALWRRSMGSGTAVVSRADNPKTFGFSVRCVKD